MKPFRSLLIAAALATISQASLPLGLALANTTCTVGTAPYTSIQSAINDASCTTVAIPGGTYKESLSITRNISLKGAGAKLTILQSAANTPTFDIALGTNVSIDSLSFTNQKGPTDQSSIIANLGTLILKNIAIDHVFPTHHLITNNGNMTISNSDIANNTDYNLDSSIITNFADLVISNSTIHNNSTSSYNIVNSGGNLSIENSSITNNSGNAIFNQDYTSPFSLKFNIAQLTIVNTTIADNGGSAILHNTSTSDSDGIMRASIKSSTIANNGRSFFVNQLWNQGTVPIHIANTLISNSSIASANCSGAITSDGHNIEMGTTCGLNNTGDLPNIDALVGPVGYYGSPMPIVPLLSGSPAINAGNGCPSIDQLGKSRTTTPCDIGAVEFQAFPLISNMQPDMAIAGGADFTLTVNGQNFTSGSKLLWNGQQRQTNLISSSQITAKILSSDILTGTQATLSIQDNSGLGSQVVSYTIQNPAPYLASISHTNVEKDAAAFTMILNGTNFVPTSIVSLEGTDLTTTFVSSTQLRAVIPSQHVAKSMAIWVRNPEPGGGLSNAMPLNVGIAKITSLGGGVEAAAIGDTIAYVNEGSTINAIDISNPAQPTEIGSIVLPGKIHNLELVGNRLYAAVANYGFVIMDVTQPANPTQLGSFITMGYAYDVAVTGTTLYLADGPESYGRLDGREIPGLSAFDVSDAQNPKLIVRADVAAWDIDIMDNVLYAATNAYALKSYDISDPSKMTVIDQDIASRSYGVRAINNRVYTTEKQYGLNIYDTATHQGFTTGYETNARDVDVDGNRAYVVTTDGKLIIFDVTNLQTPQIIGAYASDGDTWDVRVKNGRAYLLDGIGGLKILDVSQAGNPTLLGTYTTFTPNKMVVQGTTAYVSNLTKRLSVVDLSTPQAPALLAQVETAAPTQDIVLTGTLLLVAESGTLNPATSQTEGGALQIFDTATNPPTLRSTISISAPLSLAVEGTTAFIGTETGIEAYSFQNSSQPQKLVENTIAKQVTALGVRQGLLYVGTPIGNMPHSGMLEILDTSAMQHWVVRSSDTTYNYGPAKSIQIDGTTVYMGFDSSIEAFDVSNPDKATKIKSYYTYNGDEGFIIRNSQIYVAENLTGKGYLQIFNMSDASTAALYSLDSGATDVYVQGNYAYVATPQGGLQVLRIDAPATPPAGNTIPTTGGSFQAPDGGPLFTFGAGTFNSTVTLIYSACAADAVPPAGTLIYGGVCYDILAITADGKTAVPQKPYTVSITGVEQSGEQPPALYWWDGGWQRETSSSYDAASKTLTATPSHFSTWGVLSGPTAPDENTIPTTGGSFQAPDGGPLFTFAAGTFASTVTLSYSPCAAGAVPPAGALTYGGVCYDILATTANGKTAVPQKPYTVSITGVEQTSEYAPALYWWDGGWQRETSSSYDAASKTLTATPSHFSTWGVLSVAKAEEEPNYTIYIPMAVR